MLNRYGWILCSRTQLVGKNHSTALKRVQNRNIESESGKISIMQMLSKRKYGIVIISDKTGFKRGKYFC